MFFNILQIIIGGLAFILDITELFIQTFTILVHYLSLKRTFEIVIINFR